MNLRCVVVLVSGLATLGSQASDTAKLETEKQKQSYVMGVEAARNFARAKVDLDMDLFVRGLQDQLHGDSLPLSDAEIRAITIASQSDLRRRQVLASRVAGLENKQAGDTFLAENKTKEGVVALPSGLQYRILKRSDGKMPTDADTVKVCFRGRLIDGTEFDRSDPDGKPAEFKVAGVIAGWKEALKLMPAGSKWELFVPASLAYGPRAAGRNIGPNSTLIFELEIVGIKPPTSAN